MKALQSKDSLFGRYGATVGLGCIGLVGFRFHGFGACRLLGFQVLWSADLRVLEVIFFLLLFG